LVAVLAGCALAVIGTGVGLAVITDGEEIHACAHKESGRLRVVVDPDECEPSEEAVSWNREGPPGPPGTTSLQIVHETTDVPTSEANRTGFLAAALCPSGMSATGGGFRVNSDGVYVKASQPFPGP
jgi:hypothetical protein